MMRWSEVSRRRFLTRAVATMARSEGSRNDGPRAATSAANIKGERDDLEDRMGLQLAEPLALVQDVMDQPEQRLADDSGTGRWIHQSRLRFEDGKMYLLRVVVDEDEHPPVIVTAYRTSKIEKYWSVK